MSMPGPATATPIASATATAPPIVSATATATAIVSETATVSATVSESVHHAVPANAPSVPWPPYVAPRDPIGDWILLGVSALVVALSFVMSTQGQTQVLFPGTNQPLPETCHFRRWTGRDCPGCGMTRAFISIAHGDWRAAWRFNPASWYFYPLVFSQLPFRAWQLWRYRRGLPPIFTSSWGLAPAIVLMVVVLGQWLVRHLMESFG